MTPYVPVLNKITVVVEDQNIAEPPSQIYLGREIFLRHKIEKDY